MKCFRKVKTMSINLEFNEDGESEEMKIIISKTLSLAEDIKLTKKQIHILQIINEGLIYD